MARSTCAPVGAVPPQGGAHLTRSKLFIACMAVIAAVLCTVGVLVGTQALASAAGSDVKSGVYAFITQPDDQKEEYTLVIKNNSDQPDAETYGATVKDWSSEEYIGQDGIAIDLSKKDEMTSQGGIYSDNSITGLYGYYFPWRIDALYKWPDSQSGNPVDMTKITKVVVPLDDTGYVKISCRSLFAGLTACEEFDLTGLDTTGNEGYYYYAGGTPDINSDTFPFAMFGFYDLKISNNGTYPCGTAVYPATEASADIAANAKCKSVKKIITGDKWDIFGFTGFFTQVNKSTYCNKTQYATAFYTTTRTNTVVARTPMQGAYKSSYTLDNPRFTNYLPEGKHVYYTSKADAEANQDADYKFCYGDADPSSFSDVFTFTAQPYDQAGYAYVSTVSDTVGSMPAQATIEQANGMPYDDTPVFKWYSADDVTGSNAQLLTTITGSKSNGKYTGDYTRFYTSAAGKTVGSHYVYTDAYVNKTAAKASGRSNVVHVTIYERGETVPVNSSSSGQDEEYPVQYLSGVKADALAVTADTSELASKYGLSSSQLKLSYQWYKSYMGGEYEAIEGATAASYVPETRVEIGDYTYYCEVTLTISTYARPVTQIVYTGSSPKFHVEIDNPSLVAGSPQVENVAMQAASYAAVPGDVASLQVKASVPHGLTGEFKYQWFAKGAAEDGSDLAVTDKTYVPEDGVISFTPEADRFGTAQYYCTVSNEVFTDQTGEDRLKSVSTDSVSITMEKTYHVKTAADMAYLKTNEDKLSIGYEIVLDNDIDLSSDENTKTWSALDLKSNVFDGQGHKITGINATLGYAPISNIGIYTDSEGALFGNAVNSTVKNLTVDGTFNSAGIAGRAIHSTIEKCIVRGNVSCDASGEGAAGIVTCGVNCTLTDCGNEAAVSVPTAASTSGMSSTTLGAAGLIGNTWGWAEISGCYNAGTISGFNVDAFVTEANPYSSSGGSSTYYKYDRGDLLVKNSYNVGTLVSGIKTGKSWSAKTPSSTGLVKFGSSSTNYIYLKNCYNAGKMTVVENTSGYTADTTYLNATTDAKAANTTNTYYLETCLAQAKTGTSKTAEELSSADMVSTLNGEDGSVWKEGALYPVLSWQSGAVPGAADPVVSVKGDSSVAANTGDTFDAIAVTATYPTGLKDAYKGTLSYQWYERVTAEDGTVTDTAIANANVASYTPSSANVGYRYYFCRVTNAFASGSTSTDSSVFTAWTKSGKDAAEPTFENASNELSCDYGERPSLSAAVNNADADAMGELSYQWYTRVYQTDGSYTDTAISRATYQTYKAPVSSETVTYVCKVTNTYEDKTAVGEIAYTINYNTELTVSTPAELLALKSASSSTANYKGVTVKLANDIDLSSDAATASWTTGTFYFGGTFDGQGHTISGLSVPNAYNSGHGLFDNLVNGAHIKDLTVIGSVISTGQTGYSGGIAGTTDNVAGDPIVIENVRSVVDVTTMCIGGGILGQQMANANVTIKNCSNWGTVTASNTGSYAGYKIRVGGFIGNNQASAGKSTIENCYNRGSVKGVCAPGNASNNSGVGGIVGYADYAQSISNCYNAGTVYCESGTQGDSAHVGPVYGYLKIAYTTMENNHYLEGCATAASSTAYGSNGSDTTASLLTFHSSDEMQAAGFVSILGNAYKAGASYPVLSWEGTEPNLLVSITEQPESEASYEFKAEAAKLEVAATSSVELSYQWYSNTSASTEGATAIADATEASYTPSTGTAGDVWYFCRVSNAYASMDSSFAHVYVASATAAATPEFKVQPASVSVTSGDEVILSSQAGFADTVTDGKGEISYQWYKMAGDKPAYGQEDCADTAIEGATEATYSPNTEKTGSYYVVATNTFEKLKSAYIVSDAATVTCNNKVIEIDSVEDLIAFRDAVNAGETYVGKTVSVKKGTYDLSDRSVWNSSIGYTEYDYVYIAEYEAQHYMPTVHPFKGVFEGNGSTFILCQDSVDEEPAAGETYDGTSGKNHDMYGLFGCVVGGELKDFTVQGNVTRSSDVQLKNYGNTMHGNQAIVVNAIEDGVVSNVCVSGDVKSAQIHDISGLDFAKSGGVGGVAGKAANTTFTDVEADVNLYRGAFTVSYYSYAGGIVGIMDGGSIDNAKVSGSVATNCGCAGGIVGVVHGANAASISKVINSADVYAPYAKPSYGKNTGVAAGGIVGATGRTFAADNVTEQTVSITNAKNSGAITGSSYVGGLVGQVKLKGTTISDCYSTGKVACDSTTVDIACFGGLVGTIAADSKVSDSYATGVVEPSGANAGGLLGSGVASNVYNCYYLSTSYPSDVTAQSGDSIDKFQEADFAGKLDDGGAFVYVPGSTPALWFETPHVLSDDNVALDAMEVAYTGKATSPKVTVTYTAKGNTTTLTEGTDYELSYSNNTAIGEDATVTVTGLGDYSGSITKSFSVTRGKLQIKANDTVMRSGSDVDFGCSTSGLAEGDEVLSVKYAYKADGKGGYTLTPKSAVIAQGDKVVTGAYDISYASGKLDVVDASALKAQIDKANAALKTVANAAALKAAIAKAQAVYDDASATSAQVNAATSELASAVKAASKKANTLKASAKAKTVKAKKVKKKARTVKAITVASAQGKLSYKKAGGAAKLSVNAKTGKITVKKGTKKGTYKIMVKVTAAGNASYLAGTKTVTVKVKVK